MPISNERTLNQSFLKKWLIPGLDKEIYKMSLEYFVVSENKEVLKKYHTLMEVCHSIIAHMSQMKVLPMASAGRI